MSRACTTHGELESPGTNAETEPLRFLILIKLSKIDNLYKKNYQRQIIYVKVLSKMNDPLKSFLRGSLQITKLVVWCLLVGEY